MEIEKNLHWFPSFRNEINVTDKTFQLTFKEGEIEIECSWDYGWGGRGTERMYIPFEQVRALMKELEDSELTAPSNEAQ